MRLIQEMLKLGVSIIFLCSLNACGQTGFTAADSSLISTKGKSIKERIHPPDSFVRETLDASSFGTYLRNFAVKPHGSKVLCYDSSEKSNQNVFVAVLDIDVGKRDLQQCADAVMRLRAEYLFSQKKYDQIHFKFTNGFNADYIKWANGYRVRVSGNKTSWYKAKPKNYSHAALREYMNVIFSYAGTSSLSKELKSVSPENMQIGDVFIKGGFPGHAVIVVDVAIHPKTKQKVFMLAQSYMPAQDIHILKSPENTAFSPWFELKNSGELRTPEWTFDFSDLKRF